MKKFFEILGIIVISFMAGTYFHKCQNPQQTHVPDESCYVVVDTIHYFDTIPYLQPLPKKSVSLGTKITLLPVFIPKDSNNTVQNIPQICNNDVQNIPKNIPDSVAVEIPIMQREYEAEEYHAWISGYDPKLDSIYVFPRHDIVTICKLPDRPKKWGIGVFAGYGITPHGLQPCAGISINYNFLSL